ncbi:MAG: hypothetical protein ACKO38_13845 [Planctomycetota bacterium]
MRLTLRTLLAYMDDLLEPQDAIQMGKRIEENKVATELVHRIRTRMRLLRLGAPKVDGKGLGADANTVAEYLDNSLAAERVPDFEKMCLESDMHLAEAASCHQILAAVLDKPAVVDPALRLRVYNLIARADDFAEASAAESLHSELDLGDLAGVKAATAFPPSTAAVTGGSSGRGAGPAGLPPIAGVTPAKSTSKNAVSRQALLAATIVLVLLLVLGGLRAIGPFDGRHPLAAMLGMAAPTGDSEPLVALGNGDPAAGDPVTGDPIAGDTATSDSVTGDTVTGDTATSNQDTGAPVTGKPVAGDQVSNNTVAGGTPVGDLAIGGQGSGNSATGYVDGQPAGTTVGGSDSAVAAAPGVAAAGGGVPPVNAVAGGVGGVVSNRGAVAGDDERRDAEGMEMGRLLSEEHMVARRNTDDDLWYRLPRGAAIAVGDHLVTLPVYRPQFILSTGVQFMVAGESSLRFGAADGGQTPVLMVETGRLLIATSGRPGAGVALNLGGQVGSLRFIDADAEAAIEVRREFVPGEDQMVMSAPTAIRIAVRRGKVGWSDPMRGGRGETLIGSGMLASFSPGGEMELSDHPFPSWSSPQPTGALERSAAEQLAGLAKIDRPLTLSLAELTQFRKTEVRSLAARCLGSLGDYRSLWNELSDERQYSYWDEALDALRGAMVRSAEDALEVRRSAEQLMKPEVGLLTQLLRGYDPSQLENGGAAELVDALDHADLGVRVLAFENLRRITGASHNYRPEKPAESRKVSLMEWRRQLKDGRIVYRQRSVDVE